jgi:DNA-directed RNA polymerase specialized sigma24 family protein
VKAWDSRNSFAMGTNMKAWTFMILRNQFYSDKRRSLAPVATGSGGRRTHPGRRHESGRRPSPWTTCAWP